MGGPILKNMKLTQSLIEKLKTAIAHKEDRLREDVSDAEVFEYVKDMKEVRKKTIFNSFCIVHEKVHEVIWELLDCNSFEAFNEVGTYDPLVWQPLKGNIKLGKKFVCNISNKISKYVGYTVTIVSPTGCILEIREQDFRKTKNKNVIKPTKTMVGMFERIYSFRGNIEFSACEMTLLKRMSKLYGSGVVM